MRIRQWIMATRLRKTVAAAVLVVGLLGAAISGWLVAPLLYDKTVIEEFPQIAVSVDVPADMKPSDVAMVMEVMARVNSEMVEAMPEAMRTAQKVSAGSFRDADSFHKGSGQATIYELENGERVLRLENLRVTNGPALVVLLSAHPDPRSGSELKDDGHVELGKLKGNIGNQNYEVPADVDVSLYRSVVIYCKPFHVIFSVAPLGAAEAA